MRSLDDMLPVYELSGRHSLAIDAPAARIDSGLSRSLPLRGARTRAEAAR